MTRRQAADLCAGIGGCLLALPLLVAGASGWWVVGAAFVGVLAGYAVAGEVIK